MDSIALMAWRRPFALQGCPYLSGGWRESCIDASTLTLSGWRMHLVHLCQRYPTPEGTSRWQNLWRLHEQMPSPHFPSHGWPTGSGRVAGSSSNAGVSRRRFSCSQAGGSDPVLAKGFVSWPRLQHHEPYPQLTSACAQNERDCTDNRLATVITGWPPSVSADFRRSMFEPPSCPGPLSIRPGAGRDASGEILRADPAGQSADTSSWRAHQRPDRLSASVCVPVISIKAMGTVHETGSPVAQQRAENGAKQQAQRD